MKKTILITGATSGMGLGAALKLTSMGNDIIGIGRNSQKCIEAEEYIKTLIPGSAVRYLACDLSSLEDVRALASTIKELAESIDVLINNAATVSSWFVQTREGIELQFAVNHLSHFLLTHLILSLLRKSDMPRIINVSSRSHRNTVLHWNNLMMNRHYGCLRAYKRSKLCNVLFTHELNNRLSDVVSFSIDPGLVNTELGLKNTSGFVYNFWNKRMKNGRSPEEAAETIIYLASSESIPESEFSHYKYCKPLKPSRYSLKMDYADRLWRISEKYCGISSSDYGLGKE
jgi:NAD(P)-dependent dehydrogenase (short-subunit alcohol dehydrogenase family)